MFGRPYSSSFKLLTSVYIILGEHVQDWDWKKMKKILSKMVSDTCSGTKEEYHDGMRCRVVKKEKANSWCNSGD